MVIARAGLFFPPHACVFLDTGAQLVPETSDLRYGRRKRDARGERICVCVCARVISL